MILFKVDNRNKEVLGTHYQSDKTQCQSDKTNYQSDKD